MSKDVNLLDDDDADDDAPLGDFDDDMDGGIGSSSSPEKKSGGLIRLIIMAVGAIVILGGSAWAGYQFWWVPKQITEQKKIEAQKRLKELKKKRNEQAKQERARRKQELAMLQKMRSEAENKVKETATEKPPEQAREAPKTPAAPAQKASPEKAPKPTRMARAEPAKELPAKAPEKRMAPKSAKPRRVEKASIPTKPSPVPAMKKAPPKSRVKPRPAASSRSRGKASASYFSVQVATCRTENCIKNFVRKLRAKGYQPFVSGRSAPSSATLTEVLLGHFAGRSDALLLATQARAKRIRVSMYRSGGRWRVSAGSFADLEDAAQRLDQVEDSGLRAKLEPRKVGAKKSGLRAVRIGKLASRRDAIAMQAKVKRAGFPGSYVVRRK